VCVPTHHGRGAKLDQLLERLAAEPGQEEIEVCISDNASRDGTAGIVERHRSSFGERLRYQRSDRDHGWGENLLRAVELARADYCWLMGSDDAPAPGSILRLLELIEEHHGTSGIHVGHLRVTPDLERIGTAVASEAYPTERATTRMTDFDEVALASYLTLFLSNNVVHRARWQQVANSERSRMFDFPLVPHAYVMGRMAAECPDWVWCPELLLISREGDIFLREPGQLGLDTRIVRRLMAELDRLWSSLYGRRSYVRRALMFKALRHMAARDALLQLRISAKPTREHVALLDLTRRFWWSRYYWRQCLPALLLPVGPLRYASGGPRRRASSRVGAQDRSVEVFGPIPSEMYTGYASWVTVRVVNRGSVTLSSAGPFAAMLACRWEDTDTGRVVHSGSPTKLWPPVRPGTSRIVELSLTPPPLPGRYRLVMAPVEQYDGWYDLDQSASGARAIVDVRPVPGRQPGELVASVPGPARAAPEQGDEPVDPVLRPWHRYFRAAARAWLRRPGAAILLARTQSARRESPDRSGCDHLRAHAPAPVGARVDAVFVAMMWDIARRRLGPSLDELEEARPADRLTVQFRGRHISRELATSALDLSTIAETVPLDRLATARAVQLGGSCGRMAWAMLSLHREARYVLVDGPSALAIAQRYLMERLPGRRVFKFRRFDDAAAVVDELMSSEIAFLTPDQLVRLPPLDADLWLSVSSLQHLPHDQLAAHLQQADRHVSGWAYTKQWMISVNALEGVANEQADYPYPSSWRRVLERPHVVQRDKFEALFELPR